MGLENLKPIGQAGSWRLRLFLHGKPRWDASFRAQPLGSGSCWVRRGSTGWGAPSRGLGSALLVGMASFAARTLLAQLLGRQLGGPPFVGGVTVSGRMLVASCRGHSTPAGCRLHRWLLLGSGTDPTHSYSSPQGRGSGKAQAARPAVEGEAAPAGRAPCRSRCARLQLAPRPRPFLPSLFCSGPFDLGTRPLYVALGLARPPRPTHGWGFPFHLELGARGSERDGRRGLVVSQNLGDSAFSGALWPRGFDIFSGNRNKGEARGSGKVMLLARALMARPSQARPLKGGPSPRRTIPFRWEDWPVTPVS